MSTPRTRRALGIGGLLVSLALLLTGCMKMDMDLVLSEDNTVSGSMVMAFSDEIAQMTGQDPETFWEENQGELDFDGPDGATQEPYAEDGYTGSRFTFADQPLSEFGGDGSDDLSITREGDDFVVSGLMDFSDDDLGTGDEAADAMTQQFLEGFQIRIAITFPGEVYESTGTVEGTTVVWTPQFGEVTEISARGSAVPGSGGAAPAPDETDATNEPDEPGATATDGATTDDAATATDSGSGFPLWLAIGLGLLALAIVALVLWLVLRKKDGSGDPAATYAQGYPGQQPGQHTGQYTGQYGQPQPGQHPGQPGQPQPGQYAPQQPPGQPYPGQHPPPGAPGQPGYGQPPGTPQAPGQGAPPGQNPPGQPPYASQRPPTQYAPPPAAQPTQPLPTQPPAPAPQPTQPLPPQPGPDAPAAAEDAEIDDTTRLRPRDDDPPVPPA